MIKNKKKVEVHFYTNAKCNLRCKHCYENLEELSIGENELLQSIQIQRICDILDERFDIDIHMEGGEVFLREARGTNGRILLDRLEEKTQQTPGSIQIRLAIRPVTPSRR